MNQLSEAWAQASEEPSKVSDCPVSGFRTGKEPHAGSHQTADTKEPQHLHKGSLPPPPWPKGPRASHHQAPPTQTDVLKFHRGVSAWGVRDLFLTLGGWPSRGAGPKTLSPPPPKGGKYLFWGESLKVRENLLIKESLTLNGLESGMIPSPTSQSWREE